jgi:polyhydroxyalkanoic acid synthase PhaR subunit
MNEQAQTPDLLQLWRDWLTQTERQFNAFFSDALNRDLSARTMGSYLEMHAGFQRLVADMMQRYLEFWNLPSRKDIIGLADTLRTIEDRLARVEEALQMAAAAVDARDRDYGLIDEPVRTRRPTGTAFEPRRPVGASPVPEELRR